MFLWCVELVYPEAVPPPGEPGLITHPVDALGMCLLFCALGVNTLSGGCLRDRWVRFGIRWVGIRYPQ